MAVSDKYLRNWWRDAVHAEWRGYCIICDEWAARSELECHHIVHCGHRLLRHDRMNGVLVHKAKTVTHTNGRVLTCHQYADTIEGHEILREKLGEERWEYLRDREFRLIKDYLVAQGVSRSEFENWELKRLKAFVAGCALDNIINHRMVY